MKRAIAWGIITLFALAYVVLLALAAFDAYHGSDEAGGFLLVNVGLALVLALAWAIVEVNG